MDGTKFIDITFDGDEHFTGEERFRPHGMPVIAKSKLEGQWLRANCDETATGSGRWRWEWISCRLILIILKGGDIVWRISH